MLTDETQDILSLQPISILIVDVRETINRLSALLEGHLIETDIDLYSVFVKGTNKRLLSPEYRYYTPDGLVNKIPLTSLEGITSEVVDETGRIVISASIMNKKNKFLVFGRPTESKIIPIIDAMVKDLLNRRIKKYHHFNARNKLLGMLKPESACLVDNDEIDNCCDDLLSQVERFIGTDIWNIYFINFIGTDLFINKSYDLRIYEWTKQHHDEFERSQSTDS